MPRPPMKKRTASRAQPPGRQSPVRVEHHDTLPEDRCYLCDAAVGRTDEVVRVHDATMHRRCYEQDIRRGR